MDLNAIVAGVISMVNPRQRVTMLKSNGYDTAANGKQTPKYITFPGLLAQVQPLSSDDLRQLAALNIQPNHKAMYLEGMWDVVNRSAQQGGDMVILADGTTWLATVSLEDWDQAGWTKLAITQQITGA